MRLVVGHVCAGCGFDASEVACEECGAPLIWNRERGSHCEGCGLSAPTVACPGCGRRAELDKRQDEYRLQPTAKSRARTDDNAAALAAVAPRRSLAWIGAGGAIVLSLAVHGLIVVALLGDDNGAASGPDVVVVDTGSFGLPTSSRGAVLPSFDALPVPAASPPTKAATSVSRLHPPPPNALARTASPPHRDGWLQRFLRSGRSPAGPSDSTASDPGQR